MIAYTEPSCGFAVTQPFLQHDFDHQLLEFWRISFVWFSFWHSKTPHLLFSIPYCLTNGVQFIVAMLAVIFIYCAVRLKSGKVNFKSLADAQAEIASLEGAENATAAE